MDIETLRYPVGRFVWTPEQNNMEAVKKQIDIIGAFPDALMTAAGSLNDSRLDTVYRPGGWTLRQVVHHCADSHLNSYIRFKLALTEDIPTIKPYLEDRWALLPDGMSMPVAPSLKILEGLHYRWTMLLRSLSETDFQRSFYHPEQEKQITLMEYTAFYAWHCRHHLAHITICLSGEKR